MYKLERYYDRFIVVPTDLFPFVFVFVYDACSFFFVLIYIFFFRIIGVCFDFVLQRLCILFFLCLFVVFHGHLVSVDIMLVTLNVIRSEVGVVSYLVTFITHDARYATPVGTWDNLRILCKLYALYVISPSISSSFASTISTASSSSTVTASSGGESVTVFSLLYR